MRWTLAAIGLTLLAVAAPAIGSFHETIGVVPDRTHALVMQGTSFNGLHAPDAPLLQAYLGERVRFLTVSSESHTFHLHGHPWISDGRMIDVFLVKPDTPHAFDITAGGPDAHAGDWMYHCHFDEHMAEGMWGIFRVYPFMTDVQKIDHTLHVTLARLGGPVEGARFTVTVDGEAMPAHVEPEGDGRYQIHAVLPEAGVIVVTAERADLGESVARLALGDAELPRLTVTHGAHARS